MGSSPTKPKAIVIEFNCSMYFACSMTSLNLSTLSNNERIIQQSWNKRWDKLNFTMWNFLIQQSWILINSIESTSQFWLRSIKLIYFGVSLIILIYLIRCYSILLFHRITLSFWYNVLIHPFDFVYRST